MQVHILNTGRLDQSRKNTSLSCLDVEHSKLLWNVLKYKLVHYLFSSCSNKRYAHLGKGSIPCVDYENGVIIVVATELVANH